MLNINNKLIRKMAKNDPIIEGLLRRRFSDNLNVVVVTTLRSNGNVLKKYIESLDLNLKIHYDSPYGIYIEEI